MVVYLGRQKDCSNGLVVIALSIHPLQSLALWEPQLDWLWVDSALFLKFSLKDSWDLRLTNLRTNALGSTAEPVED
jgi:hypothetical protein